MVCAYPVGLDDLKGRSRPLHALLPPASLGRLPPLFGLHGTTADSARRLSSSASLLEEGIRKKERDVGGTDGRGLFLYVGSGTGFDFKPGWQSRVMAGAVRESISSSVSEAFDYAKSCSDSWRKSGAAEIETGLGIVVVQFRPDALGNLKEDEGESPVPGALPRYLPVENFGSDFYRILGAIYTDGELSRALHAIASSPRLWLIYRELGSGTMTSAEREMMMGDTPYPLVNDLALLGPFREHACSMLLRG